MNRRDVLASAGSFALFVGVPRLFAAEAPGTVSLQAHELYERATVFDANCGPPTADKLPFPKDMLDIVRSSGVSAVKTTLGGTNGNFEETLAEIAFAQRIIEFYPDVFLQVREIADIAKAKQTKRLGIILSFESSDMLDGKVERIELFRGLGVRVMQLSYNKTSPFGAGVLADPPTGLTKAGHKAIAAMNALGVALDVSHANPQTTSDAIAASKKPVLVTHAGCDAIHKHPRNKTDAQLKAIADKGGCVGIYDLPYLTASPKQPTVDDYVAHMVHALNACGEDHVGIGSDASLAPFDTSPAGLAEFQKEVERRKKTGVAAPEEDRPLYVIGLNGPRRCEVIANALLKRGYPPRIAEKVLGANFIAALTRIWS